MLFDPLDKKNKIYINYFKEKRVLIVEPQKSIRTNLKKIILDMGVVPLNMNVVDTIDAAVDWIKMKKPHYVFTSYAVKEKKGTDLIDLHKEVLPNRFESGFCLLSNTNDHSAACAVLDDQADFFISQPFTIDKMTMAILKGIKDKLQPTPFQIEIAKAQFLIAKEKYDEALKCLDQSESTGEMPAMSYFYRGEIYRKQNDLAKAIAAYKKGLAFHIGNYHCLSALTEVFYDQGDYAQSYEYMEALIDNFPVSISRFPRFIELIIKNQKFSDLFHFTEIFEKISEYETDNEEVKKKLIEGLIQASQAFIRAEEKQVGVDAALKAIDYAYGSLPVLKEAIPLILEARSFQKVDQLLEKYHDAYSSELDFKVLELNLLSVKKDYPQTLATAMDLMRKKVKEPKVYTIAIFAAKEMKRNKDFIEDLVYQAGQAIPEKKDYFAQLINN